MAKALAAEDVYTAVIQGLALQGNSHPQAKKIFDEWIMEVRANAWDSCLSAMKYEDGTPVEIVSVVNPYRAKEQTNEL